MAFSDELSEGRFLSLSNHQLRLVYTRRENLNFYITAFKIKTLSVRSIFKTNFTKIKHPYSYVSVLIQPKLPRNKLCD